MALLSGVAFAQPSTRPSPTPSATSSGASVSTDAAMKETKELLDQEVKETGRTAYSPETAVKFKDSDNVYVKSVLSIDFPKERRM